jgi:hypothetical protein
MLTSCSDWPGEKLLELFDNKDLQTILVKKFFRAISRIVWFCFRRYRRFEDHLCLHPEGCWVGVGLVGDPVLYLYLSRLRSQGRFGSLVGGELSRLVSYCPPYRVDYIHSIDVFLANKTILVKKFFWAISRVVWFCLHRYRRFENHLCLHPQGWVGVDLVGDPVLYL